MVVTGESYVWKFDNAFCGGSKVPERAFGPEAMNATFDELTTPPPLQPPQIQSNVGFCQQVLFYLVPPLANINANYQRGDFLVCSLMFLPHFSSVIISNMDTGIRYFICQIQPLFIHFCFQTSFSQNLIFYIVKYLSSIENLEMA